MDRKLDLKVGQSVVIKVEEASNASRRVNMSLANIDEWCFDGEVTKVGRKYITVKFKGYKEEQFVAEDDYRQKYTAGGADYKLYLTKQDVIDEKEANNLYSDIRTKFGGFRNNNQFTLDQLQRITNIINENK
jgi:hypothetical protein